MLSIEDIVEKYRSLFSEETLITNMRKDGFSKVAIDRELAWRRESAASDAQDRLFYDSYRQNLLALSRAEQISRYLGLFGSHERALALWEATVDEPAEIFWPVWLENWCNCDGLWPFRKVILSTFRRQVIRHSPIDFLNAADRRLYEELPDRVSVFRGCGRRRVRGLAWTTDRSVAEFFARGGRFSRPRDPVIATTEIAKDKIFFVLVVRQESEIILDPDAIARPRLESASDMPIRALTSDKLLGTSRL